MREAGAGIEPATFAGSQMDLLSILLVQSFDLIQSLFSARKMPKKTVVRRVSLGLKPEICAASCDQPG